MAEAPTVYFAISLARTLLVAFINISYSVQVREITGRILTREEHKAPGGLNSGQRSYFMMVIIQHDSRPVFLKIIGTCVCRRVLIEERKALTGLHSGQPCVNIL